MPPPPPPASPVASSAPVAAPVAASVAAVAANNNHNAMNHHHKNNNQKNSTHRLASPSAVPVSPAVPQASKKATTTNTTTNTAPNNNMMQQQVQQQQQQPSPIDGRGMYDNWRRQFASPAQAIWDLMDNAFDAVASSEHTNNYSTNPHRRNMSDILHCIAIDPDRACDDIAKRGLVFRNTAHREIAPLSDILMAYKSSKNKHHQNANHDSDGDDDNSDNSVNYKTSIGENGVGVKQGCATLSDLSFVLTRNHQTYSLGIISRALQTPHHLHLPHYTFAPPNHNNANKNDMNALHGWISGYLRRLAAQQPPLRSSMVAYGMTTTVPHDNDNDNTNNKRAPQMCDSAHALDRGIFQLASHFCELSDETLVWGEKPYAFGLIVHRLIHQHSSQNNMYNNNSNDPNADGWKFGDNAAQGDEEYTAQDTLHANQRMLNDLLARIKEDMPKQYLHVDDSIRVLVDDQPVSFTYWQRRLTELTRVKLWVNNHEPLGQDQLDRAVQETPIAETEHPVLVYLGFESSRARKELSSTTSSCQLYWHSRQNGRLIKSEAEARLTLGLTLGSTQYCQGLTVIVDDYEGELPLNPTKTDFAFAELANGEAYSKNLCNWVGAVTKAYWMHFESKYLTKGVLTNQIAGMVEMAQDLVAETGCRGDRVEPKSFRNCEFSRLEGLEWCWSVRRGIFMRPNAKQNIHRVAGRDTLMILEEPSQSTVREATANKRKRRKTTSTVSVDESLHEDMVNTVEVQNTTIAELQTELRTQNAALQKLQSRYHNKKQKAADLLQEMNYLELRVRRLEDENEALRRRRSTPSFHQNMRQRNIKVNSSSDSSDDSDVECVQVLPPKRKVRVKDEPDLEAI